MHTVTLLVSTEKEIMDSLRLARLPGTAGEVAGVKKLNVKKRLKKHA